MRNDRQKELEEALLEYIQRYGMTERARAVFAEERPRDPVCNEVRGRIVSSDR